MKQKKRIGKAAITVVALLFWILVWFLAAEKIRSDFILPSPMAVFPRLFQMMGDAAFYETMFASFLRITAGFLLGSGLGFLFGFLTHFFAPLRVLLTPLMNIVRATPVASFILVVIFWIEKDGVPGFISLLMVLPIVWQNTVLGLEKRDGKLTEMARVYRLGFWKTLWRVDLPQVLPFTFSACRTGLGLAWKAGVAAEVLALPKVSVGIMIYEAKLYLETVDLYAWTVAIIIFSVIIEKIFSALFRLGERRKVC